MKKKLLLILPILLLTSCSIMGNKNEGNDNKVQFGTVEEFIPSNFDNNYGNSEVVSYDTAYEQNYNATLRVRAAYKNNDKVTYTLASGFVYQKTSDGYVVVTSASQIAYKGINANEIALYYEGAFEFTTSDYRKYQGTYLGSYPEFDIALFNIKTNDFLPTAILGNSDENKIGQEVSVIGTPNVDTVLINTFSKGVISGLNRRGMSRYASYSLYTFPTFQFDAPTNSGMEGGIVVNKNGEVIGITSTKQHGDEGFESLSFAVAINDAKPIIDQLIEKGTFDRVTIGFTGSSIDFVNKVEWASNIGVYSGIYVVDVLEGTLAGKNHLEKDTIITGVSINDGAVINISNMEEFQSQLVRLKKNDVFKLHTINQHKQQKTIAITI